MPLSDEDLWYCNQNGYYHLPEPLPADLIERLNEATDGEIAAYIATGDPFDKAGASPALDAFKVSF